MKYYEKSQREVCDSGSRFYRAIFVYRDPAERFVSTFINKFVDNDGAEDIKRSYYRLTGLNPEVASFSDFMVYAENDFQELDLHLYPQKSHLWEVDYIPILMSRLEAEMAVFISSKLAKKYFGHRHNSSNSESNVEFCESLVDVKASEIRMMRKGREKVSKNSFLTESSLKFIKEKYRNDYEMISEISSRFPSKEDDRDEVILAGL